MADIFDSCVPRDEVLKGELSEDIFAARLLDVLEGKAEPVYQNPEAFFDNTYPTSGLKDLLEEALGRLTGKAPANNPVIRVETSFGGGKTHNLIALYHIASGKAAGADLEGILAPDLVPREDIRIAGIVGSDFEPSEGMDHGAVRARTLWGELAYQVGGEDAYRLIEKADQERVAPGTQVWEKVIGDQPTLILIDEIARYQRTAKAVQVGETTLSHQTVPFLMSLFDYASSKQKVVVVFTMAHASDAFGEETEEIESTLSDAETESIAARKARIIKPTEETEISAIVSHRLFKSIDREAAKQTAAEYQAYLRKLLEQDADLPPFVGRAEFSNEIIADYPFHPMLMTALDRKISTITDFQRTRGALRLLAIVVRKLWEQRPPNTHLIHPHSIDLSDQRIVMDLTTRLRRPQFGSVIEADIVSPRAGVTAHAAEIDRQWVEAGKPPYARHAATTVFIHSLTSGVGAGLPTAEILASVLQPDDDPALVNKALESLYDTCWFLDYDGRVYKFQTEPSLNKIIADEINVVGKVKAKEALEERIKRVWKKGALKTVYFPSEASEVDDDAKEPKLVVLHYDAAAVDTADPAPPDLARKIFDYTGMLETYRTYKNNLVFLVADKDQVDRMVDLSQRYLATARIVDDPERLKEFSEEQKKKLKKMHDESELDLRVAITKAYKHLYYPSGEAPKEYGNLAHETLPPQSQGDVRADQSDVVIRTLLQSDKILSPDKVHSGVYMKSRAWPTEKTAITTEVFRKMFAQRTNLKMMLDVNILKKSIKDGIENDIWVYYDAREQAGYGSVSPPPVVEICDDTELYLPEEAAAKNIPIKGKDEPRAVCPVCGNEPCTCEVTPPKPRLEADGTPTQAFQKILDACADGNISSLSVITVSVRGNDKEAAEDSTKLGLAVPQLGKADFRISQSLGARFKGEESISIDFKGSWDRYRAVKQLADAMGKDAEEVATRLEVRINFPDGIEPGGDRYQQIAQVFSSLNVGRIMLSAEALEGGD